MKLKTFVEEIEENEINTIMEVIIGIIHETIKEDIMIEGLTTDCVLGSGKNGIEDTIDIKSLQDIMDRVANNKSNIWSTVVNKSACMQSMMGRINGAPCDVTVDNPGVKKVVTDKVQALWMKLQTAGAQNAKLGVKAVFDAMKKTFAIEYKSIVNAPPVASA